MSKKHKIKIKKIAFTKLRKLDVYKFYYDIVSTISEHDIKAMHIEDTCDVLIDLKPKAELLKATNDYFGAHQLTPQADAFHEMRLKFAATITNQMRTLEKADLAHNQHLVKLTKMVVFKHLNYLRQKDLITVEEYINLFFYELKKNQEVKDALLKLGFESYLHELESANNGYKKIYKKRNTERSRRHKGSTTPIQRELINHLRILFDQVDSYQHIYLDVDYSVLITALNHTIATYTKLIKTRETQRKNKKLKAKEDEEAALEEKLKMGRIEKTTSGTVDAVSSTSPRAYPIGKKKTKPSTTAKNYKGKDKPIDGQLNILKKPDKGNKEDGAND